MKFSQEQIDDTIIPKNTVSELDTSLFKPLIAKVVKTFSVDHKGSQYWCLHRLYKNNIPVTQIVKNEVPFETKRQIGHLNESKIINVVDLWRLW